MRISSHIIDLIHFYQAVSDQNPWEPQHCLEFWNSDITYKNDSCWRISEVIGAMSSVKIWVEEKIMRLIY
jgi:hypothetical protein